MTTDNKSWPNWTPAGGVPGFGYYDVNNTMPTPGAYDLIRYGFDDIPYACCRLISEKVADARIRLFVKTSPGQARPKCLTRPVSLKSMSALRQKRFARGTQVEEVLEHPALDLLYRCNAYHNYRELVEFTDLSLSVMGNAFWFVKRDHFGIPGEIYLLPAQQMEPERDEDLIIRAWKMHQGTETVLYQPEDIIHFRLPNLLDPYGLGKPPVQSAWQRIQIMLKALGYTDSTLTNQGRPDIVVNFDEPVGLQESERFLKDWTQRYRGGGSGGPVVLDGKATITPLNYSPRDVWELQVYSQLKIAVCNVLLVPPDLLELGVNSNRSTRETAVRSLAEDAIKPRVHVLVAKLNERLLSMYGEDRLFFEAEHVVPEDREFALQEMQFLLSSGTITREEVREHYNFVPEEWASIPLLPPGAMPAEALTADADDQGEQEQAPVDRAGQAAAVQALQQAYYGGQLPREAALANARLLFGFSPEEAEALLPAVQAVKLTADAQPPAAPAPEAPPPEAVEPTTDQADKAKACCDKCGGEGGTPGRCPKPGADKPTGSTPHHEAAKQKVSDALANAKLSPETRQAYEKSAHTVVAKMTPKAAERFAANVSDYHFHGDSQQLTESLSASPTVAKLMAKGKTIGGAYNKQTGELHLDGGHEQEGKQLTTTGVYSHEFSHCLDGREGSRISDKPEWKAAWEAELKSGTPSRYASSSPVEGFAEFGRVVLATKLTPEAISSALPRCAAVWKKEGLL